jgi:hypothetical protein
MSLIDRTVARSLHLMPTGQTRLSFAGRRAQEVYHDVALTVDGAFRQPHVAGRVRLREVWQAQLLQPK